MVTDLFIASSLILSLYVVGVSWLKKRYIYRLEKMHPHRQCFDIIGDAYALEFPFAFQKSYELALYRTFAIPSIAELLDKTGEFRRGAGKRYDDTDLLLREMIENKLSYRGLTCLKRLNYIHGRYSISNEDYLYVLSTFIYEPNRYCSKWGWRSLRKTEREALFYIFGRLGECMGIKNIPNTWNAFEAFNTQYEKEHFEYSLPGARVAEASLQLMLRKYPSCMRFLVRQVLISIMDTPLRVATGMSQPWLVFRWLTPILLQVQGLWTRYLMLPRTDWQRVHRTPKTINSTSICPYIPQWDPYEKTYQQEGYRLERLGPTWMKEELGQIHGPNAQKMESLWEQGKQGHTIGAFEFPIQDFAL